MKRARLLLLAAVAVPICAFMVAWTIAPQVLNSDSATGFLAWDTMAQGGPWNSRSIPDPSDISKSSTEFVSWWAPGQYLFPGAIRSLGFNWSQSALLATLLANLACCLGVWLLARDIGLSEEQSALAVLISSAGSGALHGFGMYWGGDILLSGVAPFVYLAASRFHRISYARGFISFFFLCVAALFCKHGAILVIAAALSFLGVESIQRRGANLFLDARLWVAGFSALLAFVFSQWLWVYGGKTPGASGQVDHSTLTGVAFALNGPWFALTSTGSLLSLIAQSAGVEYQNAWVRFAGLLLVSGVAGTIFVAWMGFQKDATRAWRLAACGWVVVSGMLALLYIRGASVSFEERHFRPAVAPLAVALASSALPFSWRSIRGAIAALFVLGILSLGLAAHIRRVSLLAKAPRGIVSGFSQPDLKPETAAGIRNVLSNDTTLVLPTSPVALEFPDQRRIVTDVLFRSADQIAKIRFSGSVPSLVIAVPIAFDADGRCERFKATFTDIPASSWRASTIGDWRLWTSTPSEK